jgi:hypothetical protein
MRKLIDLIEHGIDWLDDSGNPIPERTNQFGRPHNWADDTAIHLHDIFMKSGRSEAESEWKRIQERNKPIRVAAIAAVGRFNDLVKAQPNDETISDIIAHEISKTGKTAKEINQGDCYYFANRVARSVDNAIALDPSSELELERIGQTYDPTAPKHWFVYHNGLIYDAETPDGVQKWQELPFYKNRSRENQIAFIF